MKDLPYFKFIIADWTNGDITLCSLEAQGLFTNLCALYWSGGCALSLAKAKRRFSECSATAWKELISEAVIKVSGDEIKINFLDEQLADRKDLSEQNRKNALKGAEIRATAERPLSEKPAMASNKEERREEKKRGEEKRGEERRMSLAEFQGLLNDEIWKEQMQMIHKFKNLDQAIAEVYGKLIGEPARFSSSTTNDFKSLVNSWLANMRSDQKNGNNEHKKIDLLSKH